MNIRRLIAVLIAPLCFCFVIYIFTSHLQPKYNEMSDVYHYSQQENATLNNSQQGYAIPLDSQQGHATPLGKNEGTNHNTPTKTSDPELSQFIIDRVKTFIFFIGFPHSGHSIVGSLLDSHPHIVVSHELNLFALLSYGKISPTKQAIFNAIWKNTKQTVINGVRARNGKGYDLLVDDLYQGKYINYIDVIGDKKGGATVDLLIKNRKKWSSIYDVLKSLNLTLKVILVLRNPYDLIASTVLINHYSREYSKIKQLNLTKKFSPDKINYEINRYFRRHCAIVNAKKTYNLDMIEIYGKDLVSDPRGTLLNLCNHLGVNCPNNYLDMCEKKLYKTESKTRRLIEWPDKQLKVIQEKIDKYDNLKCFSFD